MVMIAQDYAVPIQITMLFRIPPEESSPFLKRVRSACRRKGYTDQTEKAYLRGIVRYVTHHGTQHPRAAGKGEVRDLLSDPVIPAVVSAQK